MFINYLGSDNDWQRLRTVFETTPLDKKMSPVRVGIYCILSSKVADYEKFYTTSVIS